MSSSRALDYSMYNRVWSEFNDGNRPKRAISTWYSVEKENRRRKRRAAPPAALYVGIVLNKLKEVTRKTILEHELRITFAELTYVRTACL